MTIAETDQVKRSPNWQNYLEQVTGMDQGPKSFFPAGTKTMRKQEDDSANARHSASIAQADRSDQLAYRANAEKNALEKWMFEQELAWEKESFYAARQAALDDGSNNPIFDQGAYDIAVNAKTPWYYDQRSNMYSEGHPQWESMDQYSNQFQVNPQIYKDWNYLGLLPGTGSIGPERIAYNQLVATKRQSSAPGIKLPDLNAELARKRIPVPGNFNIWGHNQVGERYER